jgi:hypothetical protein
MAGGFVATGTLLQLARSKHIRISVLDPNGSLSSFPQLVPSPQFSPLRRRPASYSRRSSLLIPRRPEYFTPNCQLQHVPCIHSLFLES